MMRRGIGTTLGIIMFIGILFSSIVPLQLYLKENKILVIRAQDEMKVSDEYRVLEDLEVIAYPIGEDSDQIKVKIKNKGPVPVVVRRVWINDEATAVECSLQPGQEETLGPYTVTLIEGETYSFKVSTERGRIFTSSTGNLYYMEGTWYTPTLGISVQIANEKGKYYIEVSNSTWSSVYETLGEDWDDLLVFFDVKENGFYTVVMRKNSVNGPHLPGSPLVVELNYPVGPPIVFVYTSGLDT
jgi:hypothetical protein